MLNSLQGRKLLLYLFLTHWNCPDIWLMPEDCMHMTAMEVTHSRTDEEIKGIISKFNKSFPEVADYTYHHRARLVKPCLGFDSTAIALSYLPAAADPSETDRDDSYTYHHLRRDLFNKCTEAGIDVQSRYVALSAHLTMARFINQKDFEAKGSDKLDPEKVKRLVSVIEDINAWLETEFWGIEQGIINPGGEWLVGEDRGLTVREGQLWYGGGNSLYEGRGF
jgi:vesicle-fusing ATPase